MLENREFEEFYAASLLIKTGIKVFSNKFSGVVILLYSIALKTKIVQPLWQQCYRKFFKVPWVYTIRNVEVIEIYAK